MKSIIFLNMMKSVFSTLDSHELHISYNTNDPFCANIPEFSNIESTCAERDYQSEHSCTTYCLEEIVSTCDCLINMGFCK